MADNGVKHYRSHMCPACRDNFKLLSALVKVEEVEYNLQKAQREVVKQSREINKRNPNPHATEKEKYAFAEARAPQLFQKVEEQKRELVEAHRALADVKMDLKCIQKFAHDCKPANCRGREDYPWPEKKAK